MTERSGMKISAKPVQKPRKKRSQSDKIGRFRYNQKLLKRVLREVEDVKLMQRTIFAGLKGYFRFEHSLIEKVACTDEVDKEILHLLFEAGSPGLLPKDLAGGAEIAGGGSVLGWAGLLALHNAVRGENWRPMVLAVNEMQLHQLLNDDKFIHAQYLPSSQTDLEQGTVTSVLGMKVQASTLVPNGTAYAIDTRVAALMLLRRDVTAEDWEDVKSGKYGVRATTRFGLGVLRRLTTVSSIKSALV